MQLCEPPSAGQQKKQHTPSSSCSSSTTCDDVWAIRHSDERPDFDSRTLAARTTWMRAVRRSHPPSSAMRLVATPCSSNRPRVQSHTLKNRKSTDN